MRYIDNVNDKYKNNANYDLCPTDFSNIDFHLELSNVCNHECLFCPHSKMKRKTHHMDEKLAFRLIEEAGQLGIKKMSFNMNNEPFVTKDLHKYIRKAKEEGIEYTYFNTNGALASPDKLMACFDAGLDSLKFSINAGSRETYKKLHGRDDFDKVIENLKFAYRYCKENHPTARVISSFIVTKYTKDEMNSHYENIKEYVDDFALFYAQTFMGNMVDEIKELRVEFETELPHTEQYVVTAPCNLLWTSINVSCEGYLTLCCTDVDNNLVIEDLNTKSIKEAWHSERMQEMRRKHLDNNLQGTLCQRCIKNDSAEEYKPLDKKLYESSLMH